MTIEITVLRDTQATEDANESSCCEPSCCDDQATTASPEPSGDDLKTVVRNKYGAIAEAAAASDAEGCGCGPTCCGDAELELDMIGDAYAIIDGYVPDADLKLGCGIPTEHAGLAEGQTVLDLGSGAGLDAFVARSIVGETGEVLGIDMTPQMIERARANTAKLGYTNVTFYEGDIEAMPLPDDRVDVVLSNCVLNLVPNKTAAFTEMYRVLRPGGHFAVSDIVVRGTLPEAIRRDAELYVGCVSGAIREADYLAMLRDAGFTNVQVKTARTINLPDALIREALGDEAHAAYQADQPEIVSITVWGEK